MHELIFQAIVENTRAVRKLADWLKEHQDSASRDDLKRATATVIAAIRAGSDPKFDAAITEATKDLRASSDVLQEAVNKNK